MDFEELKDKAEGLASEHHDQVEAGIGKADEFAKDHVEGHDDQIDGAAEKLKGLLPDL